MKVGELIAYITLDDTQFNSGVSKAKGNFSGLQSAANTAGKAIATSFTVGTTALGGLITSLAKTGGAYNSLQQNTRAALSTMLGGTEAANAQMDKLDSFARNSPFAKQVFINAQQQMLGFGVATEKVLPALDAVQNAVAATGGSSDAIANVSYALSQMQAAGKLSGETLRDLGVYGIDAATIIGEQMGVAGSEIREMASKPGGISVDEVWDPLVTGLTEKFGGATAKIKEQWSGATDRISGAWRDIGSTLAKPFINPNGGGQAVIWANLVADGLRGIEKHVKTSMPVIEAALGSTFGGVTKKLQDANAAIAGFNMNGLIRQIKSLSDYTPLISAASAALFTLGLQNVPVIKGLAGGMMPLIAAIAALAATSPEIRAVGDSFTSAFAPAQPVLAEIIKTLADLTMALMSELAPGLQDVAEGAGTLLAAGVKLAPIFLEWLSAGLPLVGMTADLVGWLAQLPTPVLAVVAAFAGLKSLQTAAVFKNVSKGVSTVTSQMKFGAGAIQAYAWTASQGLEGIKLAGSSAASALGKVATAMKTAFIANAPMLAITALISVITAFAQIAANAKARADAYAQAMDGITDSAKKAASAAEVATNAFVTGENADWGWFQTLATGYNSAADALESIGLNAIDAGDAVAGTQSEFEAYIGKIQSASDGTEQMDATVFELTTKLHQQRNAMTDAERAQAQMTRTEETAAAAVESHNKKLIEQKEALDRLLAAEDRVAGARGDLIRSQYAAKDALEAWKAAAADGAAVTRNEAGEIDKSTDAWEKFELKGLDVIETQKQVIQNLKDSNATQSDLDSQIAESTKVISEYASAYGMSADEITAWMESAGADIDTKSLVVDVRTEEGQKKIDELLASIQKDHPKMLLKADNNPAMATLAETLGMVELEPGVFALDADEYPALAKLFMALGIVDESTGTVDIDGEDQDARDTVAALIAYTAGSPANMDILGNNTNALEEADAAKLHAETRDPIMPIYANKHPALATAVIATDEISRKWGTMGIDAEDRGALSEAERIRAQIAGMSGTMGVTVNAAVNLAVAAIGKNADGGLWENNVRAFANGGEHHSAQIAPRGTYRMFAEEETEGELYVPLAMSKRRRSLMLMGDVANRFGYMMVPKGTVGYANGDVLPTNVVAPTPPTVSRNPNLNVIVDFPEGIEFRAKDGELLTMVDARADARILAWDQEGGIL